MDTVIAAARELRQVAAELERGGDSFSFRELPPGYFALGGIADELTNMGMNARAPNGLTEEMRERIMDVGIDLMREKGEAVFGEGEVDDLVALADRLDAISGTSTAEDEGAAPGGEDNVNEDLAADLLDLASRTEDPEDKATLLKAAIEALGGNAEAPAGDESMPGADDTAPTTGDDAAPTTGGGTAPTDDDGATPGDDAPAPDYAEPTSYSGDDLRELLRSEGGNVRGDNGGFGVGDGASGTDRAGSEVDRGQALFFDLPGDQMAAGGTVNLGSLFDKGPDGNHTESATVIARDAEGRVVGEYEVRGTADGNASVDIDVPFASLEIRPNDNGAGRSSDNSDFNLQSVETKAAEPPAEPPMSDETRQEILDLAARLIQLIETSVGDEATKTRLLEGVQSVLAALITPGASDG
jgi:hypothetical protein